LKEIDMLDFEFYARRGSCLGGFPEGALPRAAKKAGAERILLVHSGGSGTKAAVGEVKKLLTAKGFPTSSFPA
jgi:hypothetical protein